MTIDEARANVGRRVIWTRPSDPTETEHGVITTCTDEWARVLYDGKADTQYTDPADIRLETRDPIGQNVDVASLVRAMLDARPNGRTVEEALGYAQMTAINLTARGVLVTAECTPENGIDIVGRSPIRFRRWCDQHGLLADEARS